MAAAVAAANSPLVSPLAAPSYGQAAEALKTSSRAERRAAMAAYFAHQMSVSVTPGSSEGTTARPAESMVRLQQLGGSVKSQSATWISAPYELIATGPTSGEVEKSVLRAPIAVRKMLNEHAEMNAPRASTPCSVLRVDRFNSGASDTSM